MNLTPSTMHGWRLDAMIGQGAASTVWAVIHAETGAPAAIKRVRPDASLELRARVRAEARVLASLSHPNLPRVLAVHDDGDTLVMERLGESAQARVAAGHPLTREAAIAAALDLLSALEFLHARGIVHRDVKPANLLEAPGGGWVLVDLDVALHPGADRPATATGAALGTWRYMAPEQRTDPRAAVPASDQWAAAALLAALLTGRAPVLIGEEAEERGEAWLAGVPSPVAAVLARATRRGPAARWASVTDMRAALVGAARVTDTAMELRTTARETRAHLPVERRAAWALAPRASLVVAVGLMVAGALAIRSVGAARAPSSHVDATQPHATDPVRPSALLRPIWTGERRDLGLGAVLAAAGDVDGDGDADLIAGSPRNEGGVGGWAVYGAPLGWAALSARQPPEWSAAGAAAAWIPPHVVNPEGYVIVGLPTRDAAGGVAFVTPIDPPGTGPLTHFDVGVARMSDGAASGAAVAWWPARTESVVYGAPWAADARGARVGHVRVLTFTDPVPDALLEGAADGDRLGSALATPDLDGDGVQDLVVGAPGASGGAGCVAVLTERPAGAHRATDVSDAYLCGPASGAAFGAALATPGDLDGDGRDDVWVGAPGRWVDLRPAPTVARGPDPTERERGAAYLVALGVDGTRTRAIVGPAGFGGVLSASSAAPGLLAAGLPDGSEGAGLALLAALSVDPRGVSVHELRALRGARGEELGAAVLLGFDGDADTLPDLLVGAPGAQEARGTLYLLPLSP